jgi:hypothetical protein
MRSVVRTVHVTVEVVSLARSKFKTPTKLMMGVQICLIMSIFFKVNDSSDFLVALALGQK